MRRISKRVFTLLFMLAAEAASQGAKAPGNSMSPKHINVLEVARGCLHTSLDSDSSHVLFVSP